MSLAPLLQSGAGFFVPEWTFAQKVKDGETKDNLE